MSNLKFKIVSYPDFKCIAPKAMVSYHAEPVDPVDGTIPEGTSFKWICFNDPTTLRKHGSHIFKGPKTQHWKVARWGVAGRHTIALFVSHPDGTQDIYERKQWVDSASNILGREFDPKSNDGLPGPFQVLRHREMAHKVLLDIAKVMPPPEEKREAHEKQVEDNESYIGHLKTNLEGLEAKESLAVDAMHMDRRGSGRTRLMLYLVNTTEDDGEPSWTLLDWTNPMYKYTTGVYEGSGDTHEQAMEAVLKKWGDQNRYPDGIIKYEFKVPNYGVSLSGEFDSDGKSFWDEVSSWFDYVALGGAVLAGVATLVLPVPGSRVVSAAIWASIFTSTTAATINISQRHSEGFGNWKDDTFDGLSIVGNLFAGAGLAWKAGASVSSASLGATRTVLIGQVSTDGLQGILLGEECFKDYQSIMADETLAPDERLQKLMEMLRSAGIAAALTYVSMKGTKADIKNLKANKTRFSKADIENPSTHIDLDEPVFSVPVKRQENVVETFVETEPKSKPLGKDASLAEAKHAEINKSNADSVLPDMEKGHPVNCVSGAVVDTQTDFVLPGRIPLAWTRHYNSQELDLPGLSIGHGWRTPADAHLAVDDDGLVTFSDGAPGGAVFQYLPGSERITEEASGSELFKEGARYKVQTKGGLTYSFPMVDRSLFPVFLERISDKHGNAIHFERDGHGLSGIALSSGQKIKAQTLHGRIKGLYLLHPDQTTRDLVEYNYHVTSGDLTSVTDPAGASSHFDYENHLLRTVTGKTGLSFHYEYDDIVEPGAKCIHTFGNDHLYDYRFEYTEAGDQTRITNSLNHTEVFEYDENSRPVRVTDHQGNLTAYAYDAKGRPTAITDPSGNRTKYSYDPHGNLLEVVRPDGTRVAIGYDANHNPVKITDPNNNTWKQAWNEKNQLTSRTSPYGATTHYRYNDHGDLTSITAPKGAVTRFQPDKNGNISGIVDPSGKTIGLEMDPYGNVISSTDPSGRTTTYTYDVKSRLIGSVKPSGGKIACQYDDEDNLIMYTDEAGLITRFEYTGLNKVAKRVNPDGTTICYTYDTEDQLTGVTNESGESFAFKRDHSGRITEEIDYYGNRRTYAYNSIGSLTHTIDPLRRKTEFAFDALGRLSSKKRHDGTLESFGYDANGNLTLHENEAASVSRLFDSENRVVSEFQGKHQIINEYDLAGNRVRRRTSNGNDIRIEYDPLNNPTRISINNDAYVDIARDAAGLPLKETFSTGLEREYLHNSEGLLTNQRISGQNGIAIQRAYEYDPMGNLTARIDSKKGASYFTYNPQGQITKAINPEQKIEAFLFDPAGNLFNEKKEEETGGRHLSYPGIDDHLDPAGNLTKRTDKNGSTLFEWDAADRLIAATTPEGIKTEMTYDAACRRVSKSTDDTTTTFTWDGDQLLSDNVGGDNYREFVFYPGTFVPLAFIDKDRHVFYFHNDAVGLPQEITDVRGKIVWSARYDSLGNIEKFYANDIDNPLRFQGQYYDKEFDLAYNRYRYFDAKTGAFVSRDPLGLAAGVNLYRYAPNVWGWVDPLGLCGEKSASSLAKKWQGSGDYPGVDEYTDKVLKKGEIIYGGVPGQSEYYTTSMAISKAEGSSSSLFQGLQVKPSAPQYNHKITGPYRPGVTAYEVIRDSPAAYGVSKANPQFGKGGFEQLFIPNFETVLKPIYSIPLAP